METRTTKHGTKVVKKLITRSCSICEKEINVTVFADKSYAPGHYFGLQRLRSGKAEYWECNECFDEVTP